MSSTGHGLTMSILLTSAQLAASSTQGCLLLVPSDTGSWLMLSPLPAGIFSVHTPSLLP